MFSTGTQNKVTWGIGYAQKYFCEVEQNGKAFPIDKVETIGYLLSFICKKLVRSSFGFNVPVYYYILYRKSWNKWWASEDNANLGSYYKKHELGESMQTRILRALQATKTRSPTRSALVVASPDPPVPNTKKLKFEYCKMDELMKWSNKYGGVFDSNDGEMIGFPKTIFSSRDPLT